ncbi:MAG: hypothetical protein ACI9SQ_000525 [Rubritalea sp.]|jgi:hypothetical protein
MKLRKKIISALTPLSLLTLFSPIASADLFMMKNGTEIKGSIISETSESYLLRAEVSNNVFAEKKILKSKVVRITKTDLSIAAYEKLSSILPTPDLMDPEDYELLVSSKVEPFLKKYLSSPHFKDTQNILSTLKKEYYLIKSGGLKLNGRLLTAEQVEADKYDIQASVALHDFILYAQKKQYRAALSTLERLEDGHPDSIQCRKSQKIALIIIPRYDEKLQKLYGNVDTLMEKRNRALDSMNPGDRNRTKRIFDYEDRRYQNLLNLATANKKKTKWLPINKYFKEPIENNLKMIQNEIKRINIASQKPTMDVAKHYRETYSALEGGDYKLAKESFDQFKRGKPPEELVNELEPRLQDAKLVMEKMIIQKREEEKIAKQQAIEEKARLAKEKREAKKNEGKNKGANKDDNGSLEDKARDKLNLNKKQKTIDELSQ